MVRAADRFADTRSWPLITLTQVGEGRAENRGNAPSPNRFDPRQSATNGTSRNISSCRVQFSHSAERRLLASN